MKPSSTFTRTSGTHSLRSADELIIKAFARIDRVALGVAVGATMGCAIFLATLILVARGGDPVGPNLALLGQYFIGYTVTVKGSLVGLLYGFVCGFVIGWLLAFLRNLFVALYIYTVKLKTNLASLNDILGQL
jgi:hypothetical protein